MSEGGAKYIETKGVVLVRERERFTFDSPAVDAHEFLRGSPLAIVKAMIKAADLAEADTTSQDSPGYPP